MCLGNANQAKASLSEDHALGNNGGLRIERTFHLNKVKPNSSHSCFVPARLGLHSVGKEVTSFTHNISKGRLAPKQLSAREEGALPQLNQRKPATLMHALMCS